MYVYARARANLLLHHISLACSHEAAAAAVTRRWWRWMGIRSAAPTDAHESMYTGGFRRIGRYLEDAIAGLSVLGETRRRYDNDDDPWLHRKYYGVVDHWRHQNFWNSFRILWLKWGVHTNCTYKICIRKVLFLYALVFISESRLFFFLSKEHKFEFVIKYSSLSVNKYNERNLRKVCIRGKKKISKICRVDKINKMTSHEYEI